MLVGSAFVGTFKSKLVRAWTSGPCAKLDAQDRK